MKLNKLIQRMKDSYPTLYCHKEETLNHLYCVIGNGYEWGVDGTITDNSPSERHKERTNRKVISKRPKPTYFYPISRGYSMVTTVPDNVQQDFLDGAFEVLEAVLECPDDPHKPFDIIKSIFGKKKANAFIKKAEEEGVRKQQEVCAQRNEEERKNKKIARELILELENRFPGRKATGGRAAIPNRVEPSMYHSKQELLRFGLDDKVKVKFGTGYRVPKKFAGRTLTFTVDNCKEYTYRIKSKVLVLKSISTGDIIVVHPTDRFECLMIDLFPVNRRPFAGWKNKEINIERLNHNDNRS